MTDEIFTFENFIRLTARFPVRFPAGSGSIEIRTNSDAISRRKNFDGFD
jgi:hypothetical protein